MSNASTSSMREIKFNMCILISFESSKNRLMGSTKHVMYFVDLVELIFARK